MTRVEKDVFGCYDYLLCDHCVFLGLKTFLRQFYMVLYFMDRNPCWSMLIIWEVEMDVLWTMDYQRSRIKNIYIHEWFGRISIEDETRNPSRLAHVKIYLNILVRWCESFQTNDATGRPKVIFETIKCHVSLYSNFLHGVQKNSCSQALRVKIYG